MKLNTFSCNIKRCWNCFLCICVAYILPYLV